jgi:N-acetylmuramoyl-L-alanine amidase
MPIKTEYLAIHTSASRAPEQNAAVIDAWHKARNFAKIGYHFVILDNRRDEYWRDGEIQQGRTLGRQGAHCLGLNDRSLGICVVGDGDKVPWTKRQLASVVYLCASLCRRYQLGSDRVIGHREVNVLVSRGVLPDSYRTEKTCPGRMVDMELVRQYVKIAIDRA